MVEKFKVGSWYKYNRYYTKFLKESNLQFVGSEHISKGEWDLASLSGGTWLFYTKNAELVVDLSEIQQYLPDGHPDKIKLDNIYELWN